ncbi:MAG: hypothetical protein U0Q12_18505 [Vicinamibacterales bacterium]
MSTRLFTRVVVGQTLLASWLLMGCASAAPRVYVRVAPPAPIVEVRGVAPGPGFVWVAGYHRWSGSAYVWVPGRWVPPARPRASWVPGHWARDRRGWFWVDGRWR